MDISSALLLISVIFVSCLHSVVGIKNPGIRTPLDLKYQTIVQQGLTTIFWEDDSFESDLNLCHKNKLISSSCHHDLKVVFDGIATLDLTSHQLLDASARSTAGILQGNAVSLGDYDACLGISRELESKRSFQGMHCFIEVELDDATNTSAYGKVYTDHLPSLGAFHPKYSMCLPSSCSTQDIENVVKQRIKRYPLKLSTPKPYPLEFDTKITCDTKETNSFYYRLMKFTSGQTFALFVILAVVTFINLCTLISLVAPESSLAEFSMITSVKRLLEPKILDAEVLGIEFAKSSLIYGGFLGHSVIFPEKVIAINMLQSPHYHAQKFLASWLYQPCNDGLLFAFAVLGGYTTYKGIYSKIVDGVFNPVRALFSRYMKYIILTSTVILLEYVYPILGDGPNWTYVTGRVFEDCQNNWWRHFVMSGHTNAIRGCSIHLYMTSVDFRLFAYGLLILYIMKRSMKLGIVLCGLTILVCNIIVHESTKHLDLPVMFGNPIDIRKAADFFYTVHFLISYYLPGYCVGILTAAWIESGHRLYTPSFWKSYLHLNLLIVYVLLVIFAPGLHNVLDVIPQSWNGVFIVLHRNGYFLMMPFLSSLISHFPYDRLDKLVHEFLKKQSGECNSNSSDADQNRDMVSRRKLTLVSLLPLPAQMIISAFLRMVVSLHAVNMLCLRYHFTVSRTAHSLRPYDILTRWNALTYMVMTAPFIFHMYFTAPLEVVYAKIFPRKKNDDKKKLQ